MFYLIELKTNPLAPVSCQNDKKCHVSVLKLSVNDKTGKKWQGADVSNKKDPKTNWKYVFQILLKLKWRFLMLDYIRSEIYWALLTVLTTRVKTDSSSQGEYNQTVFANKITVQVVLTNERPDEERDSANLKSPQTGPGLGWLPPPSGASLPCEGVSLRIELWTISNKWRETWLVTCKDNQWSWISANQRTLDWGRPNKRPP